jgi:DNA-binding response OmpR family regulator
MIIRLLIDRQVFFRPVNASAIRWPEQSLTFWLTFSQKRVSTSIAMTRILVIDDDPDTRSLLEQTLRSAGHEVVLAADGREGVEHYRAKPADLVITDLYMPNQDGFETIAQLRRCSSSVAIIAMSGKTTAGTMLSAAQKLGAVEVLQKPFGNDELLSAVGKALRIDPRAG